MIKELKQRLQNDLDVFLVSRSAHRRKLDRFSELE